MGFWEILLQEQRSDGVTVVAITLGSPIVLATMVWLVEGRVVVRGFLVNLE